MSKINILPAQVYNRIAAGEVVDRPYSVVKELVENSIDAGATEIEIYVENGGKQLIRVVDNGGGISRDDLHAAFLPHATSKIEKASDLENILTLGFRGEAVASIAAVSKMTITSKTENGGCYSLTSDGGELGEITEAAGGNGTDVKVEMLFFNTPVRLGFLKSDKAEESDIVNFVSRFILNRTDIAFKLFIGGKCVLQSFGGGEEEAIADVYGASVLQNCYKIQAEKHGIKIHGYIGNQNFFKPNKTYQSVFLNGRYIVNTTIATAISSAYTSYMMKRQYPFYVLHIEVPTEIVDVNVHPNKADVRFADNRVIYGTIYNVVSAVLDGNSKALDYLVDPIPVQEPTPVVSARQESLPLTIKTEKKTETPKSDEAKGFVFSYEDAKKEIEKTAPATFKNSQPIKEDTDELPFDLPKKEEQSSYGEEAANSFIERMRANKKAESEKLIEELIEEEEEEKKEVKKLPKDSLFSAYSDLYFSSNVIEVNALEKKTEETDVFEENKKLLAQAELKRAQNKIDITTCKYAGKLFNTYLLYERADEFYIVDQHAAHERLIFNRLKEKMQNREIIEQPMLVPYMLSVNAFEYAFVSDNLENIRSMGFDIEEFDAKTFKVSAVPADLQNIDLSKFFGEILSDISGFKGIKLENLLKDKLASAACKAAVKGGNDLSEEEVNELFRLMDGDLGLKCPHGRPVVVRMTKVELEKMFKRIV